MVANVSDVMTTKSEARKKSSAPKTIEVGTMVDGTGTTIIVQRSDVGARRRIIVCFSDPYSGRVKAYLTEKKVEMLIQLLEESILED